MLDTGNDHFNQTMQHVGSAVVLAPMPHLLVAGELALTGFSAYREVVRNTVVVQLAFPVLVGAAVMKVWFRP